METWYKYTFTIINEPCPEIAFSFKLKIKLGENILEKGYLAIQNTSFNRFKKVNKITNLMNTNQFIGSSTTSRSDSDNNRFFVKGSSNPNMNEVKNINSSSSTPLEKTKMKFSINEIRELVGCNGCYNDSLGQMSHMGCPEGCLHEKKECSMCDFTEDCDLVTTTDDENDHGEIYTQSQQNKEGYDEPVSKKRKREEYE
jgi:hypothetical protein